MISYGYLTYALCLPRCQSPLVMLSLLYLGGSSKAVARPYGTDSRLSLQFALCVVVGDTRGHAHPTAAWALGPVSSLDWTLLLQVVPLWGRSKTWGKKEEAGRVKKENHAQYIRPNQSNYWVAFNELCCRHSHSAKCALLTRVGK